LPKLPVIDAKEAEKMLLKAGFHLERSAGSHRIYMKDKLRQVIPFHGKKSLHPKIVKQVINVLEQAEEEE
jgi:predicted RNA binding protein YcfA (HicA-like mRNA interferase family)